MQIKMSQSCRENFNFHEVRGGDRFVSGRISDSGDRVQKLSNYRLWQSLPIVSSLLALSMAIAAIPVRANERSLDSTASEYISFDIEKLQEISDLFDSERVPTVADLPVYSKQAKDLLVQNTPEPIEEPTTEPAPEMPSDPSNPIESNEETQPAAPNPFSNKLGGDWGGFRRDLAASGIIFDLSTTQFFQGGISGLDNSEFDYTGVVDLFVNIDTQKAGLWEGGGIGTHLIYAYGNTSLARLGNSGVILTANTALFEPQFRGNAFEVASLYLSQKLGDNATLILGKLSIFDLLASDPFLGGRGSDRFMNVALSTPPTGITPPIIFGGIAKIQAGDVGLTFMVFDPNDQWGQTGLEDPFDDGVNFSATVTVPTKMFGYSATHTLNATYSTKEGTDLSDSQILLPNPPGPLNRKSGAYNISYQYNQFFYENPQDPKDRWGMFFKGAIADGNPNIISYSIIAGLGGSVPWRSQDSFGIGYFYYGFSGDLKDTFRPVLNLGDEQGVEIFYKAALTPGLYLTTDLQIIDPAIKSRDTVYLLGFRLGVTF